MGLPGPSGNWKGYENSDLSAKAVKFYGKNFFLIHGTADDNVHFQQSMVLTRALVDHNILFRLQVSRLKNIDKYHYLVQPLKKIIFLQLKREWDILSVSKSMFVQASHW